MIKVGIIGTSNIVKWFLEAIGKVKNAEVTALYSRTKERGIEFCNECNLNIDITSNYKTLLDQVDAVYIASPNSLHYHQAQLAIENQKHVLCEKPVTINLAQLDDLIKLAEENNVIFMEALKLFAMPSFQAIKNGMAEIGVIRQVFFTFCQYSPRYDLYKKGLETNILSAKYGSGSLMDIGIYCIYPCIALFGKPERIQSSVTMLNNGVDGSGSIILTYDGFIATLMYSKTNYSVGLSEIMGEEGSVSIEHISAPHKVNLHKNGEDIRLDKDSDVHHMYYEIQEFINSIEKNKLSDLYCHKNMRTTMKILEQIRLSNNIIFDDEKLEQ
ncbi:hypothetical protein AN640_00020 [Candidatus Epulonipiscium fishelsonii]|uniref:Uncharacterized protein n=1 Tax=Candidatus Epulonipiscium fishelsonii TaxID=77094 RepID=A0ACC8XJA6_9FIRM|nr:hypothetical protein AN640_00020 [Epulopiscium sp. SCG-D08WGA-EpuloA1]OON94666.1 MAG: hypothetical protein ATN32_08010 [Epulopiscium sp. AS2M-Bin002]